MKIDYRKADLTNLEEVTFIAETDSQIPVGLDDDYFYDPKFLKSRIEFFQSIPSSDFFEVALDGQKIVAFHLVKKTPYFGNLEIASVITLWVDPEYRRQGIATELKKRGETWAKSIGLEHIQTAVHESNMAMFELNQAQGYEVVQIKLRKKIG